MATQRPIHEVRDKLSHIVAEVEATGEDVEITRHGRVVAVLSAARSTGVILGAGERRGVRAPSVDELTWSDDDIENLLDGSINPG